MSILIKGMKMPEEGCKDCLLVKRGQVFDICPFLKREVNGNVERGGKPLACPLVPVPPHGRLIDADAVEAEIERNVRKYYDECCGGYYLAEEAKEEVHFAPTIIEAEEEQE